MDPVTQGVRRGAAVFGFFKAWRKNRRENKRRKELGLPTEDFMVIDNGRRTTTNAGVSGLVVWGILQAVTYFFPDAPTEGLEEALGAIVAYFVGYITKTPAQPKVL
jgi:hypothetical protein